MPGAEQTQLGALIRRFRLAAGLSQEELAERSGLSIRGVSDLERSLRRIPRLETIRMLADGLELTESERSQLLLAARPELQDQSRRTDDTPETRAPQPPGFPGSALPFATMPLIGREQITRDLVSSIVEGEHRLITLTGPGGVGKTRLAIEAAHLAAPSFPDGAVFVDLAPVSSADQVPSALARALGIAESGDRPVRESLVQSLRNRHMLLLLDNFEQVIDAAPLASELRSHAPSLHILVTTREALRVRGEREMAVQPLVLPTDLEAGDVDQLAKTPAVSLFVAVASAAHYGFALTAANGPVVAEICRRLDGLPLAIELAATRVKHLPPSILLEHLEQRLPVLTGGPRDLPARQQTLRDAIGWSYDLLSPDDQVLFRQLGVFAGGISIAAIESIVSGAQRRGLDVLSGLASLVDKSLVRRIDDPAGTPRYSMLETIREFALERLSEAGESETACYAHAAFFLEFVESQAGEHVGSYRGLAKVDSLDVEIENIRLAIEWFLARGDALSAARFFIELYNYFYVRGLFREASTLGERVLELPAAGQLPARLRGRSHSNLSVFRTVLGDAGHGETLARRGLTILQESPDKTDVFVWALVALVFALREQGRYEEALGYAEQAHAASIPLGDPSLAAFTRYHMGKLAYLQGDLDHAATLLSDSLDRSREIGPNETSLYSAIHLAAVRAQRGELREAAICLHAAESVRRPAGSGTVWFWLDVVGALAAISGSPAVAVHLFAAYSADAASKGAKADWAPWIEDVKAQVREELGESAFEAAWREGLILDLDDAAAMALDVLDQIEQSATS